MIELTVSHAKHKHKSKFCRNYTLMSFYTNSLNSANLGGNVYVNNLIGGGFDVVAAVAVTVLLKKFNRRHTMIFSVTMFGSLCIFSQLVKQGTVYSYDWFQTTICYFLKSSA